MKIFAWTVIGIWFTRGIIFRLINIDFATIEVARSFRQVWILLIPLSIGILIYKSWTSKTSKGKKVFGLTLGVAISAGLIIFFNFFSSFCEWQFDYVRYEHKTENKIIQNRFFDCGATTSGEPYELVITQPLGQYLIKYEVIEDCEIDTAEWKNK
jgi:hypothetical protein